MNDTPQKHDLPFSNLVLLVDVEYIQNDLFFDINLSEICHNSWIFSGFEHKHAFETVKHIYYFKDHKHATYNIELITF